MTRRMLDSRLWANEHFGEMSMMARLLLLGIINHADDQGRIKGKLMYLRTEIFRYDREVTDEQVGECLKLIEANGTIECYAADGKDYVQLLNWWDYQSLQYAAPSEYPRPAGWQDRIRYNGKGHITLICNWVTPVGKELDDTCDQDGNPLPMVATLPPRNPGGRPPVNGRGNPGGNINRNINININKEQTEEEDQAADARAHTHDPEPTAPAAPPPQADTLDPKALIADLRQRQFMYLDKDATAIAARLIADYGWTRVMEAADRAETMHKAKIADGTSGITAPLAYMRSVLAGTPSGSQQARGFPNQSMGEASVDKFFARLNGKGH